jgi:predicted PolB exonuclease-like 3'-5' exonuclease
MIPCLVFDLETIPDAQGLRSLNPDWQALPDNEVVELALTARRESHGNDFLPLHLHKVAAVACVFRDDNGFRVRSLGTADDPEPALLTGFFKTIERYTPRLISWNGSGFDLPVLHYRCLIHGVQAARYWDLGDDDRDFKFNNYLNRYHTRHLDLMDVLAQYQPRAYQGLDTIARLCGFPGKLGMDGSQVPMAIAQGRLMEVRNYCETDVLNTYLLYQRFRLMRGEIDAGGYAAEVSLARERIAASGAQHWKEYLVAWDAGVARPGS